MKLAFHTQYYPPEIGAPQRRISHLAQMMAARGHDVSVLTAVPSYPMGRIFDGYARSGTVENVNGVHVRRTAIYPTQRTAFVPRVANYASFALSSLLQGAWSVGPRDFLMTESPPLLLGPAGRMLAARARAKWIFNVSDLWPSSAVELGALREGPALRAAQRLEAYCYRKAWLVTCQSRDIADDISRRFPGTHVYHLSNGADASEFSPSLRTRDVTERLRAGYPCAALYAGLHGIAQGLDQILDAATMIGPEAGVRFVLKGDGPEKAALERRTHEAGLAHVAFEPPSPSKDMPSIAASADIAIITLKQQLRGAVPSKVYEAMASGVPVVLVASAEAAQIVRQANAGIVIEPGDAAGVASAVASLARDPERRRTLGANGRAAVEKLYDRNEIARRFEEFLAAHLSSHGD